MTTRVFASYHDPDRLLSSVRAFAARENTRIEAYTPYYVEGLSEALGLSPSRISQAAFAFGLLGAAAAYFIQWYLNAYDYPINVGARPPHFPLSYVPISFEVGILCAALATFFGVVRVAKLGRLWQPLFEVPEIQSVTRDCHWLELSLNDDADVAETQDTLRTLGAEHVLVQTEATWPRG